MDRAAASGGASLRRSAVLAIAIVLGVCGDGTAQSAADLGSSALQDTVAPLRISPERAVSLALANNLRLESARRSPAIADFSVGAAAGAWNPSIVATFGQGRASSPASGSFDRDLGVLSDRQVSSDFAVSQLLPWGTSYEVGWSSVRRSNNSLLNRFQPELSSSVSAVVSQPLLRDVTIDAARADHLRQLQVRERAELELEDNVTSLKREVLHAYWRWVYTREIRVVATEALTLARALLDGNRERVAARAMAATDVIEAEAEVARRDEAVIVADKNVANAEDQLRLLILDPRSPEYFAALEPGDVSEPDAIGGDDPVRQALMGRSDIRALTSAIQTDDISLRQFRNDALPDVMLSAGVSARAVGGTELIREGGPGTPVVGSLDRGFGLVLGDLGQFRYPGWSVQLTVGYPVGAAVAKANAARAQVQKRQTELSLAALEQQVTIEVRAALREVETNEKRLQSTATAVTLAERRLAAEEEKFLVGLSTSFFVFQAQRDLASARAARQAALLEHRLSVADLEAVQSAPIK